MRSFFLLLFLAFAVSFRRPSDRVMILPNAGSYVFGWFEYIAYFLLLYNLDWLVDHKVR